MSTRAVLSLDANARAVVPPLPKVAGQRWHRLVVQWWASVWRSPMAGEYIDADKDGLLMLAQLYQDFWTADGLKERAQIAAEIRQHSARFGLSPVDRRRLQWEIERGEQAVDRTASRRKSKTPDATKDPREALKIL